MKKVYLFVCFIFIIQLSFAKDVVEVSDLIFEKPKIIVDGESNCLEFNVEIENEGDYYISFWLSSAEMGTIRSENFVSYNLLVNGNLFNDRIIVEESGWHECFFRKEESKEPIKIHLNEGANTIIIEAKNPIIPEVSSVILNNTFKKGISNISMNYESFINKIWDNISLSTRKSSFNRSVSNTINNIGTILPNPCGNYYHHMDVDIKYTTVKWYRLEAGDSVSFASYCVDEDSSFEYVMDVYYLDDPEACSWSVKSNDVGDALLNVVIPFKGFYMVSFRPTSNGCDGFVNININTPQSSYFYTDCVVSGIILEYPHDSDKEYNYFTANATGDASMLIEGDGAPGRIIGYNQYYFNDDGTDWGFDTRIKKKFLQPVKAVHVFSESSRNPIGVCDVYIKCPTFSNTTLLNGNYFPNLRQNDAIESGPPTCPRRYGGYNCFAWAGGITTDYVYPEVPDTQSEAFLDSLDAFYANPNRYAGAMVYTREGATAENSVIDLWYNPVAWNGNGTYTHASVRGRANNHPHGYAWESKLGEYERIFHPRMALCGDTINNGLSYGYIKYHYRQVDTSAVYVSLEESVAENMTIIENVVLTSQEEEKIDSLLNKLSYDDVSEVDIRFQKLRDILDSPWYRIQSNPKAWLLCNEYNDFISFCKEKGMKIWPYFYKKINNGDFYSKIVLKELVNLKYKDLYSEISQKYSTYSMNDGKVLYRTQHSKMIRLIKCLLSTNTKEDVRINDSIIYSNSIPFSVDKKNQIRYELLQESYVQIFVYDLNRNIISKPLSGAIQEKGKYSINLNIPKTIKSPYVVVLMVNGIMNSKKIKI